jgi:hypothetical protein
VRLLTAPGKEQTQLSLPRALKRSLGKLVVDILEIKSLVSGRGVRTANHAQFGSNADPEPLPTLDQPIWSRAQTHCYFGCLKDLLIELLLEGRRPVYVQT